MTMVNSRKPVCVVTTHGTRSNICTASLTHAHKKVLAMVSVVDMCGGQAM